ncbi:unnamed protein product [Symbiodinium microadriaticum]|nr:unnamed protein product [Symbiodinium microadriaticum]
MPAPRRTRQLQQPGTLRVQEMRSRRSPASRVAEILRLLNRQRSRPSISLFGTRLLAMETATRLASKMGRRCSTSARRRNDGSTRSWKATTPRTGPSSRTTSIARRAFRPSGCATLGSSTK